MGDILLLYVVTRLYVIADLLAIVGLLCLAGWLCLFVICLVDDHMADEDTVRFTRWKRRLLWPGLLTMAIAAAIPSKTDMAIIIGGKAAIEAERSGLSQEVMDAIRAQLKKAKE